MESSSEMLYLGWALQLRSFPSVCAKGVVAICVVTFLNVEVEVREGRNTLAKSHWLKKSAIFLSVLLTAFLYLVTNHKMHNLNYT